MSPSPLHTDTLPPIGEIVPEPNVGDMLGPYRLESVAGEGGMGRVFCSTHTKLDKRVAIKILRRRYSRRPESIARFFQEARAVNVIRHPNIVEITDFLEGPTGGDSYYIMEWLEGSTLAERLRRDKTLSVDLVVHVGRQMAAALAEVHKAGFVHRDLKPDNIFLITVEGRTDAKILDFGVAMLQGPTDGAVAGTPAYFSPEGAAGRALDGRSDIYSLGVMLYELLSGAPPFQASSLSEYVMKHMTAQPRPLAEMVAKPLPPSLVHTIEKCLAKNPEDRFESMAALEAALASLVGEGPPHPARGMPWAWIALGALLMLVAAAGITRVRRGPWGAQGEAPSSDTRAPEARPSGATGEQAAPQGLAPVAPMDGVVEPATAPGAPDTGMKPSGIAPAARPSPIGAMAPAASPAATAERVTMHATTDPPGVEGYRAGVLLGVTPCKLRLTPVSQELEFTRTGFRPQLVTVVPRDGGPIRVILAPLSSRPRVPPRGNTINPFD